MNNQDQDFINDPVFKNLRKFAAKPTGKQHMPAELFEVFRTAKLQKARSKWIGRTVTGLVVAAVALPSLSYAHVLPKPVADVVDRVVHIIVAPVRAATSTITNDAPNPSITSEPSPSPQPQPTDMVEPSNTPIPKVSSHKEEDHKNDSHGETSGLNEGKSEESKGASESTSNSESESESNSSPEQPGDSTKAPSGESSGGTSESKSGPESEKSTDTKDD